MKKVLGLLLAATVYLALTWSALAQMPKASPQVEWERVLESTRKEGKVVVSIPASAELRRGFFRPASRWMWKSLLEEAQRL